VNRVSKA
jgi:hypothetical protein